MTAYLAPDGFAAPLAAELAHHKVPVELRHDRLFVTSAPPVPAAWAANVWLDVEETSIASIGDAARRLRARQRNWAAFAPLHRGRARLIAAQLAHVSARPLELGEPAPRAPLGSWTLVTPDRLLFAPRCSSPFPNGEPRFVEDPSGPPSRAYLKLWEAFVRMNRWPRPGDTCLDLGASPGGWTWTLAALGAEVVAVDRSPLDPGVARMPGVRFARGSAFDVEPRPLDWLVCDVAAYPDRTAALIERWHRFDAAPNLVVTVKFQGKTDLAVVDRLRALARAEVFHAHHNKHELTFVAPR